MVGRRGERVSKRTENMSNQSVYVDVYAFMAFDSYFPYILIKVIKADLIYI